MKWRDIPTVVIGACAASTMMAQSVGEWARMAPMALRTYSCVRATTPIQIDGKLDDAAWQQAPWTEEFVDIEGSVKPKPKFRTRARMLWDDQNFYIAAELIEPHVWGTIKERDAVIFQDPDFEVFIDPDADSHQYYEFEMNALNTVWDLRLVKAYKDGGPALNEWHIAGLRTAVHVDGTLNDPKDTDRAWTLEISMPWAALKEFSRQASPPRNADRWRVNFSRVQWQIETAGGYRKVPKTPEDNWVWSPTGIVDMHRPEKWGIVEFTTEAKANPNVKAGPEEAVRDVLQEVYYAQRTFHAKEKRFATTLAELGFAPGKPAAGVVMKMGTSGWEASVPFQDGKRKRQASIRQDGFFRVE